MDQVLERITRIEEQIKEMRSKVDRIEGAVFGDSNFSLKDRITRVEEKIRSTNTLLKVVISLLVANIAVVAGLIMHLIH